MLSDVLSTLREAAMSESNSVTLPSMDQPHFISMWRTFYDIFIESKLEQDAYHSIVRVGTLLISLGDAGKNHKNIPSPVKETQSLKSPLFDEEKLLKENFSKKLKDEFDVTDASGRPTSLKFKKSSSSASEEKVISHE